jgi:hypothetical protein
LPFHILLIAGIVRFGALSNTTFTLLQEFHLTHQLTKAGVKSSPVLKTEDLELHTSATARRVKM